MTWVDPWKGKKCEFNNSRSLGNAILDNKNMFSFSP